MARPKLTPAEKFFYDNAGWAYDPAKETAEQGRIRGARLLAKAEQIADENGWHVRWEEELEPDYGDDDPADVEEVLVAVLEDGDGNILGSLGNVMFGRNTAESRRYGRVVEAELALEAATEQGLLKEEPKRARERGVARLPTGWTIESAQNFWNSVGGTMTGCIRRMEGSNVDDPAAFCGNVRAALVEAGVKREDE